jgi:predicted nucleotidyltransferase
VLNKLVARKLASEEVKELLQRSLEFLVPTEGLESILLFGSAARGEMTDASDLDFVCIFDTESNARKAPKAIATCRVFFGRVIFFVSIGKRLKRRKHKAGFLS